MRKLTIVLCVLGLALAGCGNDSDGGDASGSGSGGETSTKAPVKLEGDVANHGTKDVADGATLEMEQDDFYFGPTFIKSTPGATITVELHNEGKNPHTFTIDGTDVDIEVPAGGTDEVEVVLPASGATAFYCRFHKTSNGMQGAFFFKEGDTVNASPGAGGGSDSTTTTSDGYN